MTRRPLAISTLAAFLLAQIGCNPSKPASSEPQALYDFHCPAAMLAPGNPADRVWAGRLGRT